jgi:hypothetical protein
MALRVARGLFRLWLVLSVLWIGGVGYVTWQTLPTVLPTICDVPASERPDWGVDCSWLSRAKDKLGDEEGIHIQHGILFALVPPAFVLALGSALVWAVKGFR